MYINVSKKTIYTRDIFRGILWKTGEKLYFCQFRCPMAFMRKKAVKILETSEL